MSGPAPAPDPRTSRDATPPGTAALLLRPVGYLAIGLVWTTIGLFVVGLSVALAAYGLFEPPADQEPWAELVASPGAVLGRLAVIAPIAVVLAGPVAWYLSCAIWPLAALSFVYAGRALRPSYRGDRLSFTSHVAAGTTVGPPVPGPVAMSLQPQRRSRLTDTLVRFSACGWNPDLREFWPAVPAGIAWALASVGASTALPPGWRVGLVVAAVPFALWSVVALRRAWTWRFHRERARLAAQRRLERHGDRYRIDPRVVRTRPQSAEHRAAVEAERAESRVAQDRLTSLTSDEIGERREAVLRARRDREAREAREGARRDRRGGTPSDR
ncbi:hypothetical protein [Cellulosimicrobium cellulans]|uniref:Uncharacterized protein n=1 Tax=Cellulosimicrobium cellulans TaxID=1710 RepID=A0A4Y4DV86_CELCE|nr:hypothetical protein [Cellulosimicrobium cellulans]GED09299.1 hypothetical protein CCE02nite_12980 [Cellulosimicrobium cellulans]